MAKARRRTEEAQQNTESIGFVEGLVIYHNTASAEVGPPQVGQAWASPQLAAPPQPQTMAHLLHGGEACLLKPLRELHSHQSQHPPTSSSAVDGLVLHLWNI